MKAWIIVTLIIGLLLIAGITAVSLTSSDNQETEGNSVETANPTCGNSCTAGNDCGRQECGVTKGTGGCGCRR